MKVLHLRTGCRLHFGLMELATEEPLRYAGLGLMLDQPGFELSFTAADHRTGDLSTVDSLATDSLATNSRATNSRASTPGVATAVTVDASEAELPNASIRSDSAELKLEYEHRMAAVAKQHLAFACEAAAAHGSSACHIRLLSALPMHSGLGAGTQLACAVATGLELFSRGEQTGSSPAGISTTEDWHSVLSVQPPISTRWLTQAAGRGLRSAIGLFGFLHGGLILDRGYAVGTAQDAGAAGESCPSARPLAVKNTQIVSAWRTVLIAPQHQQSVSGVKEAEWMAELGSLPNPRRIDMLALAQQAFTLASLGDRFADFTHCLDQYMELAGQLFSRYQGGLYNGEDVATAVECARRVGLLGIGQSSWGPTVFGFAENQAKAQFYAAQLTDLRPDWCVQVARPTAHAAEFRWQ